MADLALVAVEPTVNGFAEGISTAAKRGSGTLAVLPDDGLASEILYLFPRFERATAEQADIVCFTHRQRAPLEQALHTQLNRRSGTVVIPRVKGHGLDRPLMLISIPKAGTHLLYRFAEELGFKPGVICPENPRSGHWYCVEYSNSHTVPHDFFVDSVRRAAFGNRAHPFPFTPALFIVRHPWDILVSEARYYPKPGNAAFSGFYDGLDFDACIQRLLEDDSLLGRFEERILAFEPWLVFKNVVPLAFEDLVGDSGGGEARRQERLIWSIQLKLGIPGAPQQIGGRLFDTASPTFREGRIGGHRTSLPAALKERLDSTGADVLRAFGYSPGDDAYTAHSDEWRLRPLRYQERRFEATPILEAADYLGHNLVRYLDRFYAVPIALGRLDLAKDAQRLSEFVSADSLTGLQAALLGRSAIYQINQELSAEFAGHDDVAEIKARRRAVEKSLASLGAAGPLAGGRRRVWDRIRSRLAGTGRSGRARD